MRTAVSGSTRASTSRSTRTIDENDILHVEEGKDERGRVSAFVRSSAEVRVTTTRSEHVRAANLALAQLGLATSGGIVITPLPPPRIPPRFITCLTRCLFDYQRCLETNPVLEKIPTVCDDAFAACMSRCMREGTGVVVQ